MKSDSQLSLLYKGAYDGGDKEGGLTNFIDGSKGSGPILSNLLLYPSAEPRATNISHQLLPPDNSYIKEIGTLKISMTAHQRYPTMDVRGGGSNNSTSCPAARNLSTQICTALLQAGLVCSSVPSS